VILEHRPLEPHEDLVYDVRKRMEILVKQAVLVTMPTFAWKE
jgi:hypothetical protein